MTDWVVLLIGLAAGAALVLVVTALRRGNERDIARKALEQAQQDKAAQLAALVDELKTAFGALSREALSANADDFLKLAKTKLEQHTSQGDQALENKKKLIDARLEEMGTKLTTLSGLLQRIEKQRAESHGTLTGQLEKATQATNRLHETTSRLREALANPQRRGQWGERMAEDVLRLAGFVEGVNYVKQTQLKDGSRPDFTFPLPGGQQVHMDVKFPLENYLKVLDATDDDARKAAAAQFLRDVRARVREVTSRGYINPADGTVDFVLVFIPNEQVYGFIHEHDNKLLDDALRSKVVLCSPLTLYAILAVIRQSADNFRLEQASTRILELLAEFKKQWGKYAECMDRMGERLKKAMDEYDSLAGVRTRQLERQLDKIDDLRAAREGKDDLSHSIVGGSSVSTPASLPERGSGD